MTEFYYEISASIISFIVGTVAILIKQWQTYRDQIKKEQNELLKFRLEKFYFPIYIKLRQDKHLFDFLNNIAKEEINWEEVDVLNMKNHNEVMEIFNKLVSTANPRSDVLKEFMKYDKHTTTYGMMRQFNIIGKYPREFNCPYPENLIRIIYDRIVELRWELNYTDMNAKSYSEYKDFDDSIQINVQKPMGCLNRLTPAPKSSYVPRADGWWLTGPVTGLTDQSAPPSHARRVANMMANKRLDPLHGVVETDSDDDD